MLYKYEMHCHDCLGSRCASSLPEEMVAAYMEAGYSGLVFTNHFLRGNTAVDRSLPWELKMKRYYEAYLMGKEAAAEGFNVMFGLEHHYGHGKEVLTYGIDLDFLLANPDIDQLPLAEYTRLVREAGGLVVQAHPFRDRDYIDADVLPEPENIDAVEGWNYFNTPEENMKAAEFAARHNMFQTSGADVHNCNCESIGKAGMAFDFQIKDSAELVKALKSRQGRMIINGEVMP